MSDPLLPKPKNSRTHEFHSDILSAVESRRIALVKKTGESDCVGDGKSKTGSDSDPEALEQLILRHVFALRPNRETRSFPEHLGFRAGRFSELSVEVKMTTKAP
eukprot:9455385-Alexandrium_andersonii.AAC.1